jgi:AraC-like DNA-binding protein
MRLPPPPLAIFLGGPGARYEQHAPPPELAPWVATIWTLRVERDQALRVLPDACVDLIGADVVGPMTQAIVVQLAAGEHTTGIRLRPGAFSALFGVPAAELRDRRLALADVLRGQVLQSNTEKRCGSARPDPVGPVGPLAAVARDAPHPDPLAAAALTARDVAALARDSGYSPRHLRRRLDVATGHGPKRLARIGRMQALLRAGRGESWARAAADHGYYDEAHMANDVRALAGATPHALL